MRLKITKITKIFNYISMKKVNKNGLLLGATALMPVCGLAQQQEAKKPNIMLIVVDDMGYSDPGCFGGEVNTPNIDGLAENGIRFTQFFNSGRSCPSRGSLMTGLYPHQAGITAMGVSLNKECVTIPEVLVGAGYHTAMSGKWHLSRTTGIGNREDQMNWLSHRNTFDNRPFSDIDTYPCNRGFEEHWGTIWGVGNHYDLFSLVHNEEPLDPKAEDPNFYSTDYITTKAIDMLDGYANDGDDKPFFMYVSYNAPHWPLHAKPEDIAKYKGVYDGGWDKLREDRYNRMVELGLVDPNETPVAPNESHRPWEKEGNKAWESANMEVHAAMVDCVDKGIGKIIAKLKETGEYDNTIIVFTSDNGASSENYTIGDFDRHDRTRTEPVTRNAAVPGAETTYNYLGTGWAGAVNTPFRYWKRQSFHGGIAAPTIVCWPKGMAESAKGTIVKDPCHFIDFMPTFLEVADASYPETYKGHNIKALPAEGRSLMPIINGGHWDEERVLFWEHEGGKSVRKGDWKLTALTDGGGWQLFNMANDYSETNNVTVENPEKFRELKSLWDEWAPTVGLKKTDDIPDTEKEFVFYYPFDNNLDNLANDPVHPLMDGKKLVDEDNRGYSFVKGMYGEALKLDGSKRQNLYLRAPEVIKTAQTQFTLCMWVYDDETAEPVKDNAHLQNGAYFRDQVLMAQLDNVGTGRILLYTRLETPEGTDDVNHYFVNFFGNKHNYSTPNAFQRGKWQHVAIVSNPVDQSITFYIDGKRDRTVMGSGFEPNQGGFRIGNHKADKDAWNGKIDEMYLYRGILTPEEIVKVMNNSTSSGIATECSDPEFAGIVYDPVNKTVCTADGSKARSMAVYSVGGQELKSVSDACRMGLNDFDYGLYVVKAVTESGADFSTKLVVR